MSKSSHIKPNIHVGDLPADINLIGDIAIDTEAMGLHILRDRLCLVQMCDEEENVHFVKFDLDSTYDAPVLKSILEDSSRQKIFHFARFDMAVLKYRLGVRMDNVYCTKIASKFARTYTDNHGLKSVVLELAGVELKKDQQCTNWGAENLTYQQLIYAQNDVLYLHKVRNQLTDMLHRSGRYDLVERYFNFLDTLTDSDIMGYGGDMFAHAS